jgi:hypothetical protein
MFSASVGCVAVAGSRQLPQGGAQVVSEVVRSFMLRGSGLRVSVGCCVGVDEVVLSLCRPSQLNVYTIFDRSGAGAWSGSAVGAVNQACGRGASVVWGSARGQMRKKLPARTRAVVNSADIGLVAFFSKVASAGTMLAVNTAIARGLQVIAVCAPDISPPVVCGDHVWFPCSFSDLNPTLLRGWECYHLTNKQLFLL